MNNNEYPDETIIHLYTHSSEAQEAINAGDAKLEAGGPRCPDGKFIELTKPLSLSFTLGELKEMTSSYERLNSAEEKMQLLGEKIGLSQVGIEKISQIGWLNNAAIEQVYTLTNAGYQQTLSGLETITAKVDTLGRYVYQRDMGNLEEEIHKYSSYLKSDKQKLGLFKFDVTNSNIDEHLSDIAAFLASHYKNLMNGVGDGFLNFKIVSALLGPFANVVREYAVLFFYENNGVPSESCKDWIKLIEEISFDRRFRNKVQYYINLETDLSYKDKVLIGRQICTNIAKLPETIAFDSELALFSSKEEYLNKNNKINSLISSPDLFSKDRKIYLISLTGL